MVHAEDMITVVADALRAVVLLIPEMNCWYANWRHNAGFLINRIAERPPGSASGRYALSRIKNIVLDQSRV